MPRFFTHVRVGLDLIKDASGSELDTDEAALGQANRVARELIADLVSEDRSLKGVQVEVADETGRIVHLVSCEAGDDGVSSAEAGGSGQPIAEA